MLFIQSAFLIGFISLGKSCIIQQTDGSCAFCNYTTYSSQQNQDVSNRPTQCLDKNIQNTYTSEVYISTVPCNNRQCSGTLTDPYDNFVSAMITEYQKAEKYLIATLTFNLQIGSYYVTPNDFSKYPRMQLFRRQLWQVTIKPQDTIVQTSQESLSDDQKPIIYLRTDQFYFFVSGHLTIYGIIFDGSDMVLGYQSQFSTVVNNKSNQCAQQKITGCVFLGANPSNLNSKGFKSYGFLTTETIIELDGQADPQIQNQIINLFQSFPPVPHVQLIMVDFIDFNTGIILNNVQMDGFRSLILPNLGAAKIFIIFSTIVSSYFYDGIYANYFPDTTYLGNQQYAATLADQSTLKIILIEQSSVDQYNPWQIGSQLSSTVILPQISNTLFNFDRAIIEVTFDKFTVNNCQFNSQQNGQSIVGNLIRLISSTGTVTLTLQDFKFSENTNILILLATAGTQFIAKGYNQITNTQVQTPSVKLLGVSYFLFVNSNAVSFNILNTKFYQINGFVYYVSGFGSQFIGCTFDTVNIPSKGMIFFLAIPKTETVKLISTEFVQIQGQDMTSSIAFSIMTTNSLTFEGSILHDSNNIVLFDNRNINYNFFIYNTNFININQFLICQINRLQRGFIYNTTFVQITSSYPLLLQQGSDGGNPQFQAINCTFDQVNVKAILTMQTVNSVFTFRNLMVTNYIGTDSMIQICCFATMNSFNSTFKNVTSPQIYSGIHSALYMSSQQFLENNKVLNFVLATQKTQMIMGASYFISDGMKIINIEDCQAIGLNNTVIKGQGLRSSILIDSASSTNLFNISFNEEATEAQQVDEMTYLITILNSEQLSITNMTVHGLQKIGIFIQENSEYFMMRNVSFTDIDCGDQSCISFSNSPSVLFIDISVFQNIKSTGGNLIDVQFCESITITDSLFQDIQLGYSGLLKVFQSTSIINDTNFQQITQLKLTNIIDYQTMMTLQDTPSLIIYNVTIDNSQIDRNIYIPIGSISTLLVNQIVLIDFIIINGQSLNEPLMSFQEFSELKIQNLSTINCQTSMSILWISTTLRNLLIILDGILCDSNQASQSACLELITASNFQISRLRARDTNGGLIYVFSSNNALISMQDIQINNVSNNQGQQRMFTFIGSVVEISEMNVQNANDEPELFDIEGSVVSISSSNLKELSPYNSNLVVFGLISSRLNIMYSTIINLNPTNTQLISSQKSTLTIQETLVQGLAGQLIKLQQDLIKVQSSTFVHNHNPLYFQSLNSNLTISSSNFESDNCTQFFNLNNQGDLIYSLNLWNTTIKINYSGDIGLVSSFQTIQIKNSHLHSVNKWKTSGLKMTQIKKLLIEQSTFDGFSNEDGGCIYVFSTYGQIQMQHSVLKNCLADGFGGAIYLEGQFYGIIKQSVFITNVASIGGGLVFNAPSSTNKVQIDDCQFLGNYAKNYGGSLMVLDQALELKKVLYQGNMGASQVDKGEYGVRLGILGQQNLTFMQNLSKTDLAQYVTQTLSIESGELTIASGQIYQLAVVLLDSDNQLINIDQDSELIIQAPPGTGSATLIDNGISKSINGVFYFPTLKINHKPGKRFKVTLIVSYAYGNITDTTNTKAKIQQKQWLMNSRLCKRGEVLSQDNTCTVCGQNTYSLPDPHDEKLKSQSCQYCPRTAYCIQEAIFPKKGFWILEQSSTMVLECITQFYCLGSEDIYFKRVNSTGVELEFYINQTQQMYERQCITGQSGALCQECQAGYFKFTNTSQCLPCQGNKALTFLVILLMIGLLMAYSIYQSQNYMAKNQEGQEKAILIKIFLNYFQTTSLLGAINLNWSPNILSIFNFTSDFFGAKFNFVSVQCLANSYTQDVVEQFYLNMVVQMCIPFMIFLFNSVYFMVTVFIAWTKSQRSLNEHGSQMTKQDLKHVSLYIIILNGVVCLHLFYPLLTSTPTQLFSCQTVAQDTFGNTKQYLTRNFNIECWTDQFNQWFYSFGIFCSIFFGLGIPFLLTFYMWLYKEDFQDLDKQNLKKTVSVINPMMGKTINVTHLSHFADQKSQNDDGRSGLNSLKSIKSMKSIGKEKASVDKKSFSRHETIKKIKRVVQSHNMSSNLRRTVRHKQLKQSEVFVFLVDPYRSQVFYWEIITLLRKFVLIMIGLLANISSQDPANSSVKYLLLNVYLVIFYRLNLRYEPFYSPLFNLAENTSFLVIIITCLSGIFTSVVEGTGASVVSDIVFFTSNCTYIIFMAFIFYALLIQSDNKELQKGNTYVLKYVQDILNIHKTRLNTTTLNTSRVEDEAIMSMH